MLPSWYTMKLIRTSVTHILLCMKPSSKEYLLFSCNGVLICTQFSAHSHREIIIDIPKAIFKHSINKSIMSKSRSFSASIVLLTLKHFYARHEKIMSKIAVLNCEPCFCDIFRGIRHAFHSASYNNIIGP